MKNIYKSSLNKFCLAGALATFFPVFLWAQGEDTILLSEEFAGMIRFILIFLFSILVLTALVALLINGKSKEWLGKITFAVSDNGRDESEGKREFWRILVIGGLLILGVFVFTFNPFLESSKVGAAQVKIEPEDWTELQGEEISYLTDQAEIEAGKLLFEKKCAACHGPSGEGLVGPNLLDDFWKNGGSPQDIYNSITNGIDKTSMVAWKQQISPGKRIQIMSYLHSMNGKVEGGKEPEGELYEPDSGLDSLSQSTEEIAPNIDQQN